MISFLLLTLLGLHLYAGGHPLAGVGLVLLGVGCGFYNIYRQERRDPREVTA